MKAKLIITLLICLNGLSACGSDGAPPDYPSTTIEFTFSETENWTAGFADYPFGEEEFYELFSDATNLPVPLASHVGVRQSGNNHSDDLFMFVTRQITGLKANTRYSVEIAVAIATNAQAGCSGVGGAPGESVFVKAGVTLEEPSAELQGDYYQMNIDKGDQSASGSEAVVIGDMANTQICGEVAPAYEIKRLDNTSDDFIILTGNSGSAWVMFGTDSGYEATTDMYWESASVKLTELP